MSLKVLAAGAILACGLPLMAVAGDTEAGGVKISSVWSRATPGGAKVGAAFLEISAKDGDALISATSPVCETVELHTHTMDDGVMKMRRIDKIEIEGGKSVSLKPGGHHLMLMGLKAPLKEADRVPLTLVFEKAGPVNVEATVGAVGAKGPEGSSPAKEAEKDGGSGDHTGH